MGRAIISHGDYRGGTENEVWDKATDKYAERQPLEDGCTSGRFVETVILAACDLGTRRGSCQPLPGGIDKQDGEGEWKKVWCGWCL